jgi:hypothetical protein
MFFRKSLPILFLFIGNLLFAQKAVIEGTVTDSESKATLENVSIVIEKTGFVAKTDKAGMFAIKKVKAGRYVLVASLTGYAPIERNIVVKRDMPLVMDLTMVKDVVETSTNSGDIATVTLEEAEENTEGQGEVANSLHASRDIFQTISGYGWSVFRFRERGYDSENFPVLLNGVEINDPESGRTVFGEFGGLNDVLRSRESSVGLEASDFAFGGLGGANRIDLRASSQRKTLRASYASANRNYRNRVMLTYNSGLLAGGWAVSLSGSHRWAQEGYVPGTFFQGTSYFVSVDKKFGSKHLLNFVFLGAPNKSGRTSDSFQEFYDIAGSNYYNPNWGYQNGEKRNASVSHNNQPIGMLRYDWTPSIKTNLSFTVMGQAGESGLTRLEWNNANNPAADYHRRVPSSLGDSTLAANWANTLRSNPELMQLQWHSFYNANRNSFENVKSPSGDYSGNRSQYIVEDQRSDSRELGANLIFRQTLTPRIVLNAGVNYQYYLGENFKVVDDLLGGDFWLSINKFAAQDFPNEPNKAQFNVDEPNKAIKKGDRFGYDYNENIRKNGAWAQAQFSLKNFQVFAGAQVGQTQFWRTGNIKNGFFQDNSLGDSEKLTFTNYTAKGGITYKLNGRNYLYANGSMGTMAPQFRDVFIAPRTRNATYANPQSAEVQSIEGGYMLRTPYLKGRFTGYMTKFSNETENYTYFFPTVNEFGTLHMAGQNRQHTGVELALEAKPTFIVGTTFNAAVSVGKYIYTNRPVSDFAVDNLQGFLRTGDTVYQKNFYVQNLPQTVFSVGGKYEGKKFWFAGLTLNYRDNFWYNFDENRRTKAGVVGIEKDSKVWDVILDQEKAPAAFTLDFFGGKSFKIRSKYFVNLNLGVNNILNNTNVIVSGKDAYLTAIRSTEDVNRYSKEFLYAPGLSYFLSLALRMQ